MSTTTDTRHAADRHPGPRTRRAGPAWKALEALASLRLTVWLFVLSFFLVFVGTLAMRDTSIHTVVERYFRSWSVVWVPWQLFVGFGQVFFGVSPNAHVSGAFPYPGGWLLGSLLLVNLLAAHLIRFRLSWKRAGILMIHGGLVVMMLGEFVAGVFQVEGNMTIEEGETTNYVDVIRHVELAVIDRSDPRTDDVVVVPERYLRQGGLIQHDLLPFDVEVVRYLANSTLADRARSDAPNPATAGEGREMTAVERPESPGTDSAVDMASAYVTFHKKGTGEPLGTYLVSLWFYSNAVRRTAPDLPQKVNVDGKEYEVLLRFQREYKPFALKLHQFQHEKYIGTDTPKDFTSRVQLLDPDRGEDREVRIWMNNPLYHAGETFYQSAYLPTKKGTVLQVVRNPGWTLPYISCVLVALGMVVHFVLHLVGFLGAKRTAGRKAVAAGSAGGFSFAVPGAVVTLAAFGLLLAALPPAEGPEQMQLYEFGKIPVVDRGRVKPLDTVARTDLMILSDRQTFKDKDGKSDQPAIRWLADVMVSRLLEKDAADKHPIFRITNDQVRNLLNLEIRPGSYRYSLEEISPKIDQLLQEAQRAQKVDAKQRSLYDQRILELAQHLEMYIELARLQSPLVVPPASANQEWQPFLQAMLESRQSGQDNPTARAFGAILLAYSKGDATAFNRAVVDYRAQLAEQLPVESRQAGFETFFNHLEPFYLCSVLYVVVFLLACLGWMVFTGPLNRAAFWLAVLTLVVHTWALSARMYIQGRPPVTNLYSSAVFVGWGCVAGALILEAIFRNGLGNVVAALTGFVTMLFAHHLAGSGDTLEMMQAVLDTNFWLATHVTVVNLGYAATFQAGCLGVLYLLLGTVTPWLTKDRAKALSQKIYGMVCFGMLLSFTGTVLGGIWADQSWGRFWGWDPKENGALLVVLSNALILHARWGGLVKQRGMAMLAAAGNMVVGWSWVGTNQLGVGLHAYGFNNTLALALVVVWVGHLLVIGLGLLPLRLWWSFAAARLAPAR